MNPLPIIMILFWAYRYFANKGTPAAQGVDPKADPNCPRETLRLLNREKIALRSNRVDARRRANPAVFLTIPVGALPSIFLFVLWFEHPWQAFAGALVLSLFLQPSLWARHVAVPLGLPRLAFVLAWASFLRWGNDRPGGPLFVSALALARQKVPSQKWSQALRARLAEDGAELHATDLAAAAILFDLEGDRASARVLFDQTAAFTRALSDKWALRIAGDWLLADHLQTGDPQTLVAWMETPGGPDTPSMRFLTLVLRRAAGERVPTWRLWQRWLLAPHRRETWALLKSALTPLPPPPPPREGPARIAELLVKPLLGQSEFGELATWLQARLGDADLVAQLDARAALLSAHGAEAFATAESLCVTTLQERAPADFRPQPDAWLQDLVAGNLRDLCWATMDTAVARMRARAADDHMLRRSDEWREFVTLRDAFARLVSQDGETARDQATRLFGVPLVNYAVWLHNVRGEAPLAAAVTKFVGEQTELVGMDELHGLCVRNVAAMGG